MESDPQQKQHQFQNPLQQQQTSSSGLLRYRSAPSSYFANFVDDSEGYLETAARPSSPETDRIIARFMSDDSSSLPRAELDEVRKNSHSQATENQELRLDFMGSPPPPPPTMMMTMYNHQSSSSSSSRPPLPNHSSKASGFGSEMDGSPYGAVDSKIGGGGAPCNSSNLVRHSSSPAGLFYHLNIENGTLSPSFLSSV